MKDWVAARIRRKRWIGVATWIIFCLAVGIFFRILAEIFLSV